MVTYFLFTFLYKCFCGSLRPETRARGYLSGPVKPWRDPPPYYTPPTNKSSVMVNIGLARGASPGCHSDTPIWGWELLHCFCKNEWFSWLSRNELTTLCTRSALQRDSGLTIVPPNLVFCITGGSYSVVGLFHTLPTCSDGSTNFSTGGLIRISVVSTHFCAFGKFELPHKCRRGNRFGMVWSLYSKKIKWRPSLQFTRL